METVKETLESLKKSNQENVQVHSEITTEQVKNALLKRALEAEIEFTIDSENESAINLICQYFAIDKAFEEQGYNLNKGLMLFGNTGCGKTTVAKLLKQNPVRCYKVINCREIASEFAKGGDEAIEDFYKSRNRTLYEVSGIVKVNSIQGICFDDFGAEPIKQYFGTKIEVMEEVMLRRYDSGRPFYTTHITTNKTAQEIRDRYGDRIADRFREMFNIIEFPPTAKSRRK